MIKEIRMQGMKGTTAIQELTGRDLILGRNGAGKTTRMQAIGLTMNGYVPGKGKTAAETFKMASEDTMIVGLATDTFDVDRQYVKMEKVNKQGNTEVKISQRLYISPMAGESTIAQKEARIKQELGDFPVMMDFGAFINMTETQKRDFIYSLSGTQTEWNKDKIASVLRERSGVADTINEDFEEITEKNIEATMDQFKDGQDVQAGLLAMTEYAKEQLKLWKKEQLNSEGAARKLTELKNKGQETDRDLNENLAKMEELEKQREELTAKLAKGQEINKSIADKQVQHEKLLKEIEELSGNNGEEDLKAYKTELSDLEKSIKEIDKERPEKEKQIEQEEKRAELAINRQKELAKKVLEIGKQLSEVNGDIKAQTSLLEKVEGMNGCCAFNPGLPCNQDFTDFINSINETLDNDYEKKDAIEAEEKEVQEELKSIEDSIEAAEHNIKNINERIKQLQKQRDETTKGIDEAKKQLEKLNNSGPELAAKKELSAQIASELEKMQAVDLTDLEAEKKLNMDEIAALRAKIDEQKKFRNDLKNIQENVIDSKTAELQVQSWKNIADAVGQKGVKGEMVKEMLDPMKDTINQKIKAMGIYNEVFFETESDTGREVFVFGFEDPDNYKGHRPFEALSTGEQLIFMTCLLTSIIERSNTPVKILAIDNINDLDSNNLHIILTGLPKAGAAMDNIILSGVAEPAEEDLEAWTVHRLS